MIRKLTDEELDLAEAARIACDPSYRSARPGPRAQQAMIERDRREHQFNPHYAEPAECRDEKKAADNFSYIVQTAMLRNIVATASELSQPGPYAVKATREKPIAVKDKKGEVQYIDDGMSCKNPFNTTAAAPVPGAQNTFKLAGPKKRSEMSFAEAVSTAPETYYAQVDAQSAVPKPLQDTFTAHTKPTTFAEAIETPYPIVVPGLANSHAPKATIKINPNTSLKHPPLIMAGPALDLN